MKRFSFILAILFSFTAAANTVSFQFSDGIDDGALKTKLEQQVSALLSAINAAADAGADINYSGIKIDPLASQSIGMTWRVVRFKTEDEDIVDHCIRQKTKSGRIRGYQVRNIGVNMMPLDATYDGPQRREITIDLSPTGVIEDVNFAMGQSEYAELIRKGYELDDLDCRMQIIHWCEQFEDAYNKSDINFMETIFSDDAIIITGKITSRRVKSDIALKNPVKVQYVVQSKEQYLKGLRRLFSLGPKYLNVKFSEYKIVRHGSKPNYYGVTLKQDWSTGSGYKDQGTVFLVWDFTDETQPKIHVRTWQPLTEEAFSLGDFKLP